MSDRIDVNCRTCGKYRICEDALTMHEDETATCKCGKKLYYRQPTEGKLPNNSFGFVGVL